MRRRRRGSLSRLNCSNLEYGLAVSLDKFDLDGLKSEIKRMDRSNRLVHGYKSIAAVAPTRDHSLTDYHVHFNCHWTKKEFHASLEYIPETEIRERGDTGPFAEDIIAWIGKFFKNGKATADVTAIFVYSDKKRSMNFPVPMHLRFSLFREVEVVGMVMRIPSKPEGVYETFVTLNDHTIVVILQGNRPLTFQTFNVYDDVTALTEVTRIFVREIKG